MYHCISVRSTFSSMLLPKLNIFISHATMIFLHENPKDLKILNKSGDVRLFSTSMIIQSSQWPFQEPTVNLRYLQCGAPKIAKLVYNSKNSNSNICILNSCAYFCFFKYIMICLEFKTNGSSAGNPEDSSADFFLPQAI